MTIKNDIWKILADPTRRKLIESLNTSKKTTGELADIFPHLTRFAVMKHLAMMQELGLVSTQKDGRHRIHSLEKEPLRYVQEWMNCFSFPWDEGFDRMGSLLTESTRANKKGDLL